jgi:hypothetical protein
MRTTVVRSWDLDDVVDGDADDRKYVLPLQAGDAELPPEPAPVGSGNKPMESAEAAALRDYRPDHNAPRHSANSARSTTNPCQGDDNE